VNKTLLLARTFFTRFFESELLPSGFPQAQLFIWSVAIVVAPNVLLPFQFANSYSMMQFQPEALARAMLMHRLVFITLSMTAMGFVALVMWENVFPDRRDARQLGVLPLSHKLLILGRLLALCAVAGIFLLGVNAIPTVLYAPVVGVYGGATNPLRAVFAHVAATAGAGMFVFFLLIAVQGTWLNIGGRRTAERFAIVLQVLFVVALVLQMLLLPRLGAQMATGLGRVAAHPVLSNVPSFWFLALYDFLGGRGSASSAGPAATAVAATILTVAVAVAMLVATHARLMRLALEGQEPARPRLRMIRALAAWAGRFGGRGSIARAVSGFTLRTLARSRSHRLLLALYLGVALTFILILLSPTAVRYGLAGFYTPGVSVLAAPYVLMFFTLIGLKLMVAIPVEPKANWVMRLLEPSDRMAVVNGVRNALLIAGVAPATIAGAVSAAWLWGPWPALVHATTCAGMGWLLSELLVVRLRKIPFTCTYHPGRSHIRIWPLYLFALSNYCFTTAAIERSLMDRPRAWAMFVLVLFAAIQLLIWLRRRELGGPPGLRFEEDDPEALFAGFRLSEGLAARANRSTSSTV
jgi:hypothetical protein